MNILTTVKNVVTVGKQFVIDYAPQICMGVGVATSAGAFALAIKQARDPKNEDILTEYKDAVEILKSTPDDCPICIEDARGNITEYSASYKKKLIFARGLRMTGRYIKLYSGPVALEILSIAAFCTAFGIQTRRLAAVSALYSYYKDVAEKLEAEKTGEEVVNAETGEIEVAAPETEFVNPYAFEFDETCSAYARTGSDEADNYINFVTCAKIEDDWNNILRTRDVIGVNGEVVKYGKVYLNEIRRAFGVNHRDPKIKFGYGDPDCEMGQIVGWDRSKGEDVKIDLGFRRDFDFVAGHKNNVTIQPNCCGIINDLLKKG